MNVHAVVGHALTPAKAIKVVLGDVVNKGDSVSMVWSGPPNDTLEAVYDYVLDNDVPFCMYYADGTNPPKVFREAEFGVCQKTRNPDIAAVQSVEGDGAVLFLWDDNGGEGQIEYVFDHKPESARVLELSNGGSPITIDVDLPEPRDPEVPVDEDETEEDLEFAKEELENMAAASVKRYGLRKGCTGTTKGAIIGELFPEVMSETKGDPEARYDDNNGVEDDDEVPEYYTGVTAATIRQMVAEAKEFLAKVESLLND